MKPELRLPRQIVSVSLSDTQLHVPDADGWVLTLREPGSDEWPALRDTLAALAARNGAGHLAIALLPPLAGIRAVRLPKLRDADLSAILARTVGRYFPSVREAQVVSSVRLGPDGGEFQYTIAAAPVSLLASIQRAALDAGWTVERIVPAYSAWASAAMKRSTHARRSTLSAEIAREDGGVDVLQVVDGVPRDVRRLRDEEFAAYHAPVSRVRIENPADVAARYAARTKVLELITDAIRARRREGMRARWMATAAASVVLAIVLMGTVWWRTRTELRDIAEQRAAIQPQVARAMQVQGALMAVAGPVQTLTRVEEHGVQWAEVINELATHLPSDAYIESLRAYEDSLVIEGAATSGARVFQRLAGSDVFTKVTPVGSIRRDASSVDVERFTLAARIPNAALLVPPTKKGAPRR